MKRILYIILYFTISLSQSAQDDQTNTQPFQFKVSHILNNSNVDQFITDMYAEQLGTSMNYPLLLFIYGRDCEYSKDAYYEWNRLEQRIIRYNQEDPDSNYKISSIYQQKEGFNLKHLRLAVLEGQVHSTARRRLNVNSFPTFYIFNRGLMFEYGKRNRAAENWVEFIFLEIDNIRPLSILPYGNDTYYIYLVFNQVVQFLQKSLQETIGMVWLGTLMLIWIISLLTKQC